LLFEFTLFAFGSSVFDPRLGPSLLGELVDKGRSSISSLVSSPIMLIVRIDYVTESTEEVPFSPILLHP
jgi:hypothetical protein